MNNNSEDLNFVNILHSQKNAKIDSKVLLLFFSILAFFVGAFVGANLIIIIAAYILMRPF